MFHRSKRKNGMRVIVAPMKDAKTVTLLTLFGVGSRHETDRIAGISHFLEHMFFKGTIKRPNAKDISEYLDEVGGEYNAFTSKEYTGYYAKVTPKHVDRAFDVISDMMKNSKFEAEEIERERGVIIEEMNMYQDTPMMYVGDVFEEMLYPGQPAGRLIIGNKKSIKSVKRSDFIKYHQKFYRPENMIVCVSGKITKEAGNKLVNKYFAGIKGGKSGSKKKAVEKQSKPEIKIHKKNTDQSHIVLGLRAYDVFDKRKYALNLLSSILGGGMSSRLFISVRERLGLAYYIRCSADTYTDSGYLSVHAGVDSKKIDKAIQVILSELEKIRDEEVSEKELKKAKEFVKGRTTMGLEGTDEYGIWLTTQDVLTGKVEDLEKKFEYVDRVTTRDIQAVATDIIKNNKLNLAVVGPYQSKSKFTKYFKLN